MVTRDINFVMCDKDIAFCIWNLCLDFFVSISLVVSSGIPVIFHWYSSEDNSILKCDGKGMYPITNGKIEFFRDRQNFNWLGSVLKCCQAEVYPWCLNLEREAIEIHSYIYFSSPSATFLLWHPASVFPFVNTFDILPRLWT